MKKLIDKRNLESKEMASNYNRKQTSLIDKLDSIYFERAMWNQSIFCMFSKNNSLRTAKNAFFITLFTI